MKPTKKWDVVKAGDIGTSCEWCGKHIPPEAELLQNNETTATRLTPGTQVCSHKCRREIQ
jgi:hypothetical protein